MRYPYQVLNPRNNIESFTNNNDYMEIIKKNREVIILFVVLLLLLILFYFRICATAYFNPRTTSIKGG